MNDTEEQFIYMTIKIIRERLDELEKSRAEFINEWVKEKERYIQWQRDVEEKVLKAISPLKTINQ